MVLTTLCCMAAGKYDICCSLQGIFNFVRALWHTFPVMLHGSDQMPPIGNLGVMASGLFAFLVYTMGMLLCHTAFSCCSHT